MINRAGLFTFLTAFCVGLGAMSACRAADEMPFSAAYAAKAIQIEAFSGTLIVKVDTAKTTRLKLSGPERQRKSLRIAMRNKILRIHDRRPVRQVQNSVHVDRNVVIVGPGGYSNMVIGGQQAGAHREKSALRLELTIPAGLPLGIDGFVGDLEVGDTLGPIILSLAEGTARLGRVHAATLKIEGAGKINAERVDGPLSIEIDGSGAVSVGDGAMPSLTIASNGSAEIAVGGKAGTADIDANGVTDIRIDHVEASPNASINGVGAIEIGNWDMSEINAR
jgi:hypothetical protein